ncbi:unnamed protein product, partial [marine sediment metagenome]
SNNGLFRTFYADDEGYCNFTIPALKDNAYNISITGHNTKPSHFNFFFHILTALRLKDY